MTDKATLSHLRAQFNRLSRERQAEILGMAKALTFAQTTVEFDVHGIVQEIIKENIQDTQINAGEQE
jgi:hypothetical protein